MSEENRNPHKLKMPEGVSPVGLVDSPQDAFVKMMTAIPEILLDIADSLSMIALYVEKRGFNEGVLTNEDIEGKEEPDAEPHAD